MKLFSLKSVQYSQFLQDITSYISKLTGTTIALNKSTVFGQMISVIAGIAHNIMLYIEDSLVEQNKYTAQRKKSVVGLAAQSGYVPSYGAAAGLFVSIRPKANNRVPLDVILSNHQQLICSINGLYYNIVLPGNAMTINMSDALQSTINVYAVQGKFETQQLTATGSPLETHNIKFSGYMDSNYINVTINGIPWTRKESLYDMEPNEQSYTIGYSPTGGFDLIFGNDIYGKQLSKNDLIEVSYLMHDGENGNVNAKESMYFMFMDKLKDIAGNDVDGNLCFDITLKSDDAITSGSNSESIEQIRKMIGFNSRNMILSDSNAYSAFLNKYSFVGYNRTWSENGSMVVNSIVMRNYKQNMSTGLDYFNLKDSDFVLSDTQKDSIQNAIVMSGMQLAGTTYNILDIELCKYALYIYVKLKDQTADQTTIANQIRTLIGEFFGDIQSDSYVPKSDIINLIKQNIPEVDGVTCYFLSEKNEKALQERQYIDNQYLFDPISGTYREKSVTVKLMPGENPMLGLDSHGNILINKDNQFPVLMGGWDFLNNLNQEVDVVDPLNIVFE